MAMFHFKEKKASWPVALNRKPQSHQSNGKMKSTSTSIAHISVGQVVVSTASVEFQGLQGASKKGSNIM